MPEITYVTCDEALKKQIGEVMGKIAERHIRLDYGFALVAMNGETPIGLIAVYKRQLTPPLSDTYDGFINILEVDAGFRRQGIARRLIEMSIERCRSLGLHQIAAWSSEDKIEAIPMWKALGFTLCPATEHHPGLEVKGYLVALQL